VSATLASRQSRVEILSSSKFSPAVSRSAAKPNQPQFAVPTGPSCYNAYVAIISKVYSIADGSPLSASALTPLSGIFCEQVLIYQYFTQISPDRDNANSLKARILGDEI